MRQTLASFFTSTGFGNLLLSLILVLSALNLYSNGRILESIRNVEPSPMTSTHTVTLANDSFTFTITTPRREADTGTTLATRHWGEVEDAKAALLDLMGGS